MFTEMKFSNAYEKHHKPRRAVISKRVFTWDFIPGEIKYFHFGVYSVSYNCLHDTSQNENHCGCYFIDVILIEKKFPSGDKKGRDHTKGKNTRWSKWRTPGKKGNPVNTSLI